ncbi:hypothetical protein [Paenibacillus sp. 2TAB19]|jgi:hypothetical protein|uniref:hypothetical protein n=1 Tax=Paenibacillus sp. 2TAB19 TaxID=3233003 RepID=UPI003F977F2D
MDLLLSISVAVIAVSFVILLYALYRTLKLVRAALEDMRLSISRLGTQVALISTEARAEEGIVGAVCDGIASTVRIWTKIKKI